MSQKKKCNGKIIPNWNKNSLTPIIKRELPFPQNRKETPLYTSLPGFYLVEAAVTIPVFVCFMVTILFFFCIMQLQLEIQASLNYTGRKLSEYAVLEADHSDKINEKTELAAAEVIFRKHLKEQNIRTEYIKAGNLGIHLLASKLEGDYVHLKAEYRIKLPIGLFGKYEFMVRQQVKTRKWIGDCPIETDSGEWVYITPTGSAYHQTSQCPYLDLSIQSVVFGEVEQLRNHSGARYKACRECGKRVEAVVYITDYGDVYHGSVTCSGLKRSVQKVRLSETGGRHACLKCGG